MVIKNTLCEVTNDLKEPIELFGYECADGWLPYIKEAQELINKYNEEHPNENPVKFVQVKEKWGVLNIYLNRYPDDMHTKIREIEQKSYDTCEFCGAKGATTKSTHRWLMTLCDKCREDEIKRYNERFGKNEK